MTTQPLAFIDSGVGGLSTMTTLLKKQKYNIVYFADTKFAPYGNKSKAKLIKRLTSVVDFIIQKYNPAGIVLACNTATTATISKLREIYSNIVFIGTEPAINLANKNNFKSAAVIATPATIKNLNRTKKTCKLGCKLRYIPLKQFASEIEQLILSNSINSYYKVLKSIYKLKNLVKFSDCLILGCTHYVLVKDLIKDVVNRPIFDGNDGVSNNISQKLYDFQSTKSTITLAISSNNIEIKENYKKILRQILAKPTKLC